MMEASWIQGGTLGCVIRPVARFMRNYLHETLFIPALYALSNSNLMAWPRLSIVRTEDGNLPSLFGVLSWQLFTTHHVPILSFAGGSVIALDGKGVCAAEAQGKVSLFGLDARLF